MKKFISKLILFTLIVVVVVIAILEMFGGNVDYFYVKFTAPKQHSLIVGDSRSFQGIQPQVINDNLKDQFELPVFNYSFTLAQSAYGDAYLSSIKAKLDQDTKNGVFILSVHPWVLAQRENEDYAKGKFFETGSPPHNMNFPAMNPNPEYFFKNFSFFHFKGLFRRVSTVHPDGWIEIDANYTDAETASLKKAEIDRYNAFSKKWTKSAWRVRKLEETINYLKKYGTVILLRMPISSEMHKVEQDFWSGFDDDMEKICVKSKVRYISFSNASNIFLSHDGLHLTNESGALFTKVLCDSIKANLRPKLVPQNLK